MPINHSQLYLLPSEEEVKRKVIVPLVKVAVFVHAGAPFVNLVHNNYKKYKDQKLCYWFSFSAEYFYNFTVRPLRILEPKLALRAILVAMRNNETHTLKGYRKKLHRLRQLQLPYYLRNKQK